MLSVVLRGKKAYVCFNYILIINIKKYQISTECIDILIHPFIHLINIYWVPIMFVPDTSDRGIVENKESWGPCVDRAVSLIRKIAISLSESKQKWNKIIKNSYWGYKEEKPGIQLQRNSIWEWIMSQNRKRPQWGPLGGNYS